MHRPTHWWDARPGWLDAIYDTESELRWLSEAESRARHAALTREHPAGLVGRRWVYLLKDEDLPPLAARAVAELPTRHDRTGQHPYHPTLWVDPARPGQLWLALDEAAPSCTWLPAGAQLDELRAAYAPYGPGVHPPHESLTREASFMIDVGEDASFEDFVTFTLDQRLVDSLLWGNAVPLDPWKEEARMPASMLREALEADLRQADLERPSVSGRSVYSRSVIRVGTRLGIATVDVRYRPAPSAPTIETLNRTLGQDLPLDLPIDVAQILVGHPLQTPREIEDRLRFEGDRTGAFGLVRKDAIAFAVLHHNDLRQLRWLVAEALVHGPEERALARDLALGLGLYADHATLMSRETSPAALALADARARLDFGVNS